MFDLGSLCSLRIAFERASTTALAFFGDFSGVMNLLDSLGYGFAAEDLSALFSGLLAFLVVGVTFLGGVIGGSSCSFTGVTFGDSPSSTDGLAGVANPYVNLRAAYFSGES